MSNLSSNAEWKDWKWQLQNRIAVNSSMEKRFPNADVSLFPETGLNLQITPYMLSQIDSQSTTAELQQNPWYQQFFAIGDVYREGYDAFDGTENWDLSHEFPTPILQHKYPNRVLLYAPTCLAYCNFCFKANEQLDTNAKKRIWKNRDWKNTLSYLEQTPGLEELVFSGGDPLTLSDSKLAQVFSDIRDVKDERGLEKISLKRIHTRALTHNPFRVTPEFVDVLREYDITQLIFDVAHPQELTDEFTDAVELIHEGMGRKGITLAMHTPYLRNVNDSKDTLWELFKSSAKLGIKPYYLIATFPHTPFADKQRAPVQEMMDIMHELKAEKSIAYLPTPIVAHPKSKIVLPYFETSFTDGTVPEMVATNTKSGERFRYSDRK